MDRSCIQKKERGRWTGAIPDEAAKAVKQRTKQMIYSEEEAVNEEQKDEEEAPASSFASFQ